MEENISIAYLSCTLVELHFSLHNTQQRDAFRISIIRYFYDRKFQEFWTVCETRFVTASSSTICRGKQKAEQILPAFGHSLKW